MSYIYTISLVKLVISLEWFHIKNYNPATARNVAAKAIIAYNSGNTARTIVLPKISCPDPIAEIPEAQTLPCFIPEIRLTKPKAIPEAKTMPP